MMMGILMSLDLIRIRLADPTKIYLHFATSPDLHQLLRLRFFATLHISVTKDSTLSVRVNKTDKVNNRTC